MNTVHLSLIEGQSATMEFWSVVHLKPEPVIVSLVPPAVPPLRGVTLVITGVREDL